MFRNDYSEAVAPEILKAIGEIANEQSVGYGLDEHSKNAEKLILKRFGLKDGKVFFLSGGTQANMVVISYILRDYESVIACDTGHINVHETGAVEGSGHKILTSFNADGKLKAEDIENILSLHRDEHMVMPKMVYISDSTETGTVYTLSELKAIRKVCDKNKLLLFIDGARLGVALTSGADVDAKDIAKYSDIFYVGGTKNGLLSGEAVVIKDTHLAENFRYQIKNRGAMLAKGFVLGVQFERAFTDDLYFKLAKNSNEKANIIRNGLKKLGVKFEGNSTTNQIFIRLENAKADIIMDKFGCELWSLEGNEKVIRIVTSFATTENDCIEFLDFARGIV